MNNPMRKGGYLPPSVSRWKDPFLLCATIVGAYWAFSRLAISDTVLAMCIVIVSIAVMGVLEAFRTHVPAHTHSLKQSMSHALVTWAGTLAGLGFVLFLWGTLTTYSSSYYQPFFQVLPFFLAASIVLSFFYAIVASKVLGLYTHGDYQLGQLVLGREVNWKGVRDALLVWVIRGFFLPINFCELVNTIDVFRGHGLFFLQGPWMSVEYYVLLIVYGFIIAAVTPGYVFGARLFGTHTRDVSHSWFAWVVTLICYAPLELAVFKGWFNYNPTAATPVWNQPWVVHFANAPVVLETIGGLLVLVSLVHLWGEAQFGLRSSNISNRGIITTGAYRYTKHPVYLTKCVGWFLIWLPFLSGASFVDSMRLTFLFLCICAIYALRALAEEELLSADKDYVAYALWMDEHAWTKKIGEIFPIFRYSWRLVQWEKVR